ncbi:197_t:CDS:2 [Dentiscutata erythropus]|uniref:197_t:CDS:1 n=1 Tax=Dentiscutata erythropus TaxID=1348616 RepID=A0A9N8YY39_9GLOM|nr:197_t:CDS:2 [Dentiscutata erythropus]
MQIGRLFHYATDAILISALLAGIKRSTGLTFATERIKNRNIRNIVNTFLGVGEWVMDKCIMYMSSSPYFVKKLIDYNPESRSLHFF